MILEKFKKDLAGRELTKQEGNFSLLMYGSVLPCCFPPYINKYYNFHFRSFIFVVEGKRGTIFFDLENYRRMTTATYRNFLEAGDKENLPEYQDFIKGWEEASEFYDKTKPDFIAKLSDDELQTAAQDSTRLMFFLTSTLFSESLDESLIQAYYDELGGRRDKFADFLAQSGKLTFESFALRMDKALLDFETSQDPARIQWVLADYYSAPFIEKTASAAQAWLAGKGGRGKIKEELARLKAELEKNQSELAEFRTALPEGERKLLDFIQLCMYVRDVRKEPLQKILTLIANITRELYKRAGLPEEDIAYSCVLDFTKRRYASKSYREEIKKRKEKGFIGYFNADGYKLEYGNVESVRKELYELMDGKGEGATELRGSSGCQGYVKARVNIISNEAEFAKFEVGNVLVTSMTRPEFVPLMKRASAIITDEGGVTCHAAIVSRELNIPCIIGTKNATRILKDGDLVEVDAERGIVRIIK